MSTSTLMSASTGGATSIFGGMFSGGGGVQTPARAEIPTSDSAEVLQAKEDERERLRGMQGRKSTQVAGLLKGDAPVQKKQLLGQ